jgi:hypothetical protein
MWGREREDRMIDTGKAPSGCGEWDVKGADRPKKCEGIGRGKLGGMGMMGGWIEAKAHMGIGEKLIIGSPLSACWDNWDN